jgi:hypothetical protein
MPVSIDVTIAIAGRGLRGFARMTPKTDPQMTRITQMSCTGPESA